MSAATFTPGPWKRGPLDEENTAKRRVLSASGLLVAEARGATGPASVRDANARLIAAAPELLEACKLFQAALTEYRLRDVKKRFSLCLADAAASNAIAKVERSAD